MKRVLAVLLLVLPFAARAGGDWAVVQSPHSVAQTTDRLEQAARDKGLTVFGRVDHAQGAVDSGLDLRPTSVLIFGNPKIGTRLMQSNQRIGLDLPLRMLVWEDVEGAVWVGYLHPAALLARYQIADQAELQEKITKAMGALADAATSP